MEKQLQELDALFKALADPTRLRILGLLLTGEVCVCHVHETLGISQPKASRHLAYLRRSGLVENRRDGLWVHYRFAERGNAVVRAVEDAVRHALTHSADVRRDLATLDRQHGCGVPATKGAPVSACCPPARVAVSLSRRS